MLSGFLTSPSKLQSRPKFPRSLWAMVRVYSECVSFFWLVMNCGSTPSILPFLCVMNFDVDMYRTLSIMCVLNIAAICGLLFRNYTETWGTLKCQEVSSYRRACYPGNDFHHNLFWYFCTGNNHMIKHHGFHDKRYDSKGLKKFVMSDL